LHGSGLALVVGVAGLLWGSLGVANAVQFATNEAWGVPNRDRPAFLPRLGRGLLFFVLLGLGVTLTQALTSLGAIVGHSQVAGALGVGAALAVNTVLFVAIFKLLSPSSLGWRAHVPGALVAGVGWQVLQVVGQMLVQHNLRHTTELYGQFAIVLGLISFLSLAAQLFMYSVEVNAVLHKRMWPRSIAHPPLTVADRQSLEERAGQEVRVPGEQVDVSWASKDRAVAPSPAATLPPVREVGRGAKVIDHPAVLGRLRVLVGPDDVLDLMDAGASGVVALVRDAGATFLAPIYEDLTAVVCMSGTPRSHIGIMCREFQVPCVMGAVFPAGEPADGAEVEVDCSGPEGVVLA
jgi:hypothetical protein